METPRPLLVWSLNGQGFAGKTAAEIPPTIRWLQGLAQAAAPLPDVLCLQDIRLAMIPYLNRLPYFAFVPMTNHLYWGHREPLGICIASRWPIDGIAIHHCWGDGIVRDLEGVGEDHARIQPYALADELVLKTQNRVAVACTVIRPGDRRPLRIATHHGFWVREGIPTPQQIESTESVCTFLAEQGRQHGGLVYAADFNPDKDGRVLATYLASGARDLLPASIPTTLAAHHPAARFGVRSDCIMTWPDRAGRHTWRVEDVQLDDSPGSDHSMLRCQVLSLAEDL